MIGNFFKNFWWLVLPVLYLIIMLLYIKFIYHIPPSTLVGEHLTHKPWGMFPGEDLLRWWFSYRPIMDFVYILIPEYVYIINAFILMIVLGFVKLVFIILKRDKNVSTY